MAERDEKWKAAMIEAGHTPILREDDGGLDVWVTDYGHHNGPGCSACGWTDCMHCNRGMDIPMCVAAKANPTQEDGNG